MKNNKIPKTNTIKYNKYNDIHSDINNEHTHIKYGIKKAVTTCVAFSLVVSTMNYALALNRQNSNENVSMPHEFVIANYSVNKDNYWTGNADNSRVFYLPVDLNELVEIEDEPEFTFYDSSVQYGFDKDADLNGQNLSNLNGSVSNSSDLNTPNLSDLNTSEIKSTYRYARKIHLSNSERYTVESIVAGESGNQSFLGKKLVAMCIYNAMLRSNISPKQVIKDYQYSGYKDIDTFESECLKAYGNTVLADECRQAVSEVFDECDMPVDDFILWFYAPKYSKGKFHNTQKFIIEEGGHRFYALWEEPVINYTREG